VLGDGLFEQRVDRPVARQQIGLERGAADRAADQHRRVQRLEQEPAIASLELRMR
jgi:hypothetical protein